MGASLQVREARPSAAGPLGLRQVDRWRTVAGLHRRWNGTIRVLGTTLRPGQCLVDPLRSAVHMVFQDPYGSLHPLHRIGRIVGEPLAIRGGGRVQARVAAALAEVGLAPGIAARFPHRLSGGQRQRVAIARTLPLRPRLLILDEPTYALDLSVQAGILNLLNHLEAAHGMTLVPVSHDPAVAAHMCDRAVRMEEGRIIETLDRDAITMLAGVTSYEHRHGWPVPRLAPGPAK